MRVIAATQQTLKTILAELMSAYETWDSEVKEEDSGTGWQEKEARFL